ncbi:hypothetical protein NST33_28520 [Paenibacillus sp. FSL L8-0435]|uniref:hypothetical protein n=1 Tax=Paenibacillus TaxID=44249 RepID=UPI001C8F0274|nr:hypothetical protein [Paenibacillus xylanexedens]MBY0117358.1 hypothetical protein [Paenibacillus xylanexedens]
MKNYHRIIIWVDIILMFICGYFYTFFGIKEDKKEYFFLAGMFVFILILDVIRRLKKIKEHKEG